MLIADDVRETLPDAVHAEPVEPDGYLAKVAKHHFGHARAFSIVATGDNRTEPLVDDVWEAMSRGQDIEETRFCRLVATLVAERIAFACWASDDYEDLPSIGTWNELVEQLKIQARTQPAEVYVRFLPPASGRGDVAD
ncbi:MAG TPA: hypothetical protein VG755_34180 [Nannocystaceae bacterium]|nr:hypothetical protein [Nannocystaceae bacterium]